MSVSLMSAHAIEACSRQKNRGEEAARRSTVCVCFSRRAAPLTHHIAVVRSGVFSSLCRLQLISILEEAQQKVPDSLRAIAAAAAGSAGGAGGAGAAGAGAALGAGPRPRVGGVGGGGGGALGAEAG